MDEKLVPAHVHFVRWFIRARWVAVIILLLSNYLAKHILHITIREKSIYLLTLMLFFLNILHALLLRRITKGGHTGTIPVIKRGIHLQIITDLIILTCIIHFSGGIENPMILFYFFHMIIASSIFSTLESYLYAAFASLLVASLVFLECYGFLPHHPLEGFVSHDLYRNPFYIFGTGFIFVITSVFIVSLSHMIINRSIKSEESCVITNMELENKDKLKNEYVLRVTHDIKGHVASILSCLEVIRTKIAGPLNAVQEEFTNRAFERTELLSAFVKNLLNLTKKRLLHDNEFEEFQLEDVIRSSLIPIQALAKDKSIGLKVEIDCSARKVTGNPFMIEELYANLLLNAIKYTPEKGKVSLLVRDRGNVIETMITDNGIGIPKAELSKVFDEFYRATNVTKDIKAGSGLGLSIVKQIVDIHKGKIRVESEQGRWTRFTFLLPRDPEATLAS